jgi:hypothetical protein
MSQQEQNQQALVAGNEEVNFYQEHKDLLKFIRNLKKHPEVFREQNLDKIKFECVESHNNNNNNLAKNIAEEKNKNENSSGDNNEAIQEKPKKKRQRKQKQKLEDKLGLQEEKNSFEN